MSFPRVKKWFEIVRRAAQIVVVFGDFLDAILEFWNALFAPENKTEKRASKRRSKK